jgi:hypothetical protein
MQLHRTTNTLGNIEIKINVATSTTPIHSCVEQMEKLPTSHNQSHLKDKSTTWTMDFNSPHPTNLALHTILQHSLQHLNHWNSKFRRAPIPHQKQTFRTRSTPCSSPVENFIHPSNTTLHYQYQNFMSQYTKYHGRVSYKVNYSKRYHPDSHQQRCQPQQKISITYNVNSTNRATTTTALISLNSEPYAITSFMTPNHRHNTSLSFQAYGCVIPLLF